MIYLAAPTDTAGGLTKASVMVLARHMYGATSQVEIFAGSLERAAQASVRAWVVDIYAPYIEKLAKNLARRKGDPLEDLCQVGTIGLLNALENFDPARRVTFKTYATHYITGEMRAYLREKMQLIKTPRSVAQLYYRLNKEVAVLKEKLGRLPSNLELAEHLACSEQEITEAIQYERRQDVLHLDEYLVADEEHYSYLETLMETPAKMEAMNEEQRVDVRQAVDRLKPEQRSLVWMVYFEDKPQCQVAEELGMSPMQVSRRLRKALDKLGNWLAPSQLKRLNG